MAALAVVKVGFAEGALAVVTGHATLRARVWKMLCGKGRADLAALWKPTRAYVVATVAVEVLSHAVICVAKAYAVRARGCGGRSVASSPVTRAAGRNINSARLLARRVTLVAGLVCIESCGNAFGHAAPRGCMTGYAASLRPGFRNTGRVLRVVKLRVEASQAWKILERRVLLAEPFRRVADRAQRAVRCGELCLMATDAVFVLWESGRNGVVATVMADAATPTSSKCRVRARIRMREPGIVLRCACEGRRFRRL